MILTNVLHIRHIFISFLCTLVYPQIVLTSGQQEMGNATTPMTFFDCEEFIEPSLARAGGPQFWPEPNVPYVRYGDFRAQDHQALDEALEEFYTKTCIRFTPRVEEKSYVEIFVNLSLTRICGRAVLCHVGGSQYVEISGGCSNKITFVHELGHALCLHHEQSRQDRDDYLDFSECTKPETIPSKSDWWTMRDQIYDYGSAMHYMCQGYPCFGIAKNDVLVSCGNNVGLGPLDADKLNAFYNCKGCHAHRWFRVDTLTHQQEGSLVDFSNPAHDTQPIYMCRAYLYRSILVGKYLAEEKACLLGMWGESLKITKDVQVLGIYQGPRKLEIVQNPQAGSGYIIVNPLEEATSKKLITVGRTGVHDWPPYVAAINPKYVDTEGKPHTLIGFSRVDELSEASFVTPDKGHVWVKYSENQGPKSWQYFSIACL